MRMELLEGCTVYLMVTPSQAVEAGAHGLPLAHMAYRVGGGPHLFCSQHPFSQRGGVMVLDHVGFDGQGAPEELCREIMGECSARSFTGLFCDFEGPPFGVLTKAVQNLGPMLARQSRTLYLPEDYAENAPKEARVVVSSALTGGSLKRKLTEAAQRFGAGRLALALERVAQDVALPAGQGQARALEREELSRLLRERSPAVYFSDELCAHYFTYMKPDGGAHYILYDDASSLRKKLRLAAALGIREAFLLYTQAAGLLP